MERQDHAENARLLTQTGIEAGMPHGELGKLLGVSRRTVSRWALEGSFMSSTHCVKLAELAYGVNRDLATRWAALAGTTLASLGLEEPSRPAAPAVLAANAPSPRLVEAVVCAAADALDASPRAVRPAVLAAFRCARELGLTHEAVEAALTPSSTRVGGERR
jgi:hypothetical protein